MSIPRTALIASLVLGVAPFGFAKGRGSHAAHPHDAEAAPSASVSKSSAANKLRKARAARTTDARGNLGARAGRTANLRYRGHLPGSVVATTATTLRRSGDGPSFSVLIPTRRTGAIYIERAIGRGAVTKSYAAIDLTARSYGDRDDKDERDRMPLLTTPEGDGFTYSLLVPSAGTTSGSELVIERVGTRSPTPRYSTIKL